jgi:hypothetical protein
MERAALGRRGGIENLNNLTGGTVSPPLLVLCMSRHPILYYYYQ